MSLNTKDIIFSIKDVDDDEASILRHNLKHAKKQVLVALKL